MNTDIEFTFPYLEMGSAFVLGFAIGMALKKGLKLLLILMGLGLIFLFLLEQKGAVSLNEENLELMISSGVEWFQSLYLLLEERLQNYKAIGSMSAISGLLAGLKYA